MLSDRDIEEILGVARRGHSIARFKDTVFDDFILPKWKAEAIPLIGLEWELQAALLTERCKGKKVYFRGILVSSIVEEDDFTVYDHGDNYCELYLDVNIDWVNDDKFYIHKIYAGDENFEIASEPVPLNKLDEALRGINKFLYGYFSGLVKKGLYPFALFIPATDMIEHHPVYKHVNLNFVNKNILLENPEWKEDAKYSRRRFHIEVPYNFKSYKELVSDLESFVLSAYYQYLDDLEIKRIFRWYLRGGFVIVSYIWDVIFDQFRREIIDYFWLKYKAGRGQMLEPELLLYSKTGERLVMPGKLY